MRNIPSAITLRAACLRGVRDCDETVDSIRMPSPSARAGHKPPQVTEEDFRDPIYTRQCDGRDLLKKVTDKAHCLF